MRLSAAQRLEVCPGETVSGDAIVSIIEAEVAFFAVVDGLGHGPAAAEAASRATDVLAARFRDGDVVGTMRAVHAALAGGRGAAATLCRIEDDRIACCGVGNVALRSSGAEVPFVLSPGVLGGHVRRFRLVEARARGPLRIVLHSDGIASGLSLDPVARLETERACEALFRAHRKAIDDAALLVVDVGG